jgi:hypothetical protein
MGINLRGIGALFTGRVAPFRVTPKEGVDNGGLAVLRIEGLLTGVGVALAVAWVLRLLEVLDVVALRPLPAVATAIVIALGVWELYCIARTLLPLVLRRQLRSRYRTPVVMRGRIAGTAIRVDIVDLSVQGLAFETVLDVGPGTPLKLLTRIPDAHGSLHDVLLPLEVRSARPTPDGDVQQFGCRIDGVDDRTRRLLIEFCDLYLPRRRIHALASPTRPPAAGVAPESATA